MTTRDTLQNKLNAKSPGKPPEGEQRWQSLAKLASKFGLKHMCPENFDPAKAIKRTIRYNTTKALVVAGVSCFVVYTWTITYDKVHRCLLETNVKECLYKTAKHSLNDFIEATSVTFLTTTGGATWTKDPTFSAVNQVEAIGCGAQGQAGTTTESGGGGGGGAYAIIKNITLASNPPYTITAITSPGNTNFNSGQLIAVSGDTSARGQGTGGAGGLASACTPTAGAFNGGSGGSGAGTPGGGGGGGGAGGPLGAGSVGGGGQTGAGANTGGAGGAPGGGSWTSNPGNVVAGPGTGGTGSNSTGGNSVIATNYGGGGAGGGGSGLGGSPAVANAQGIIVISWTLLAPRVYIMG